MFIFGNFLLAVARVLDALLWLYMWIILIRIVLSWVNADPYNFIVRAIAAITDPLLTYIRRFLPFMGPLDFSPFVAFLLIIFLQTFLVQSLVQLGHSLQ